MIPPNLFGLPVLPDFDLFLLLFLLHVLEVLLADRHSVASRVGVGEDVLALRHVLVAFELPQDGSAIIATTGKKCADVVPADAVDGLVVVGKLGQLALCLDLVLVEQTLHQLEIDIEVIVEPSLLLN